MVQQNMQQDPALSAFLDYLEEYNRFLEQVMQAQNEKIEALLSHDTGTIERSVAHQQAVSMQMAGYEERRQQFQEAAGLGGLTFAQIEEQAGPEEGRRIAHCRTRMRELISQIRFLNDKAMHLVETNLQILNLSMPPEERTEAQGYDGKGRQSAPPAGGVPLFETKI